jgi:hypothetical protein
MVQQINLYDPALERRRDWLALSNVAGIAALLLVVVAALGFAARHDAAELSAASEGSAGQLKALREQIAAQGQAIAGRKPDAQLEQEVAAKRMLLAARGEVLGTLRRSMGTESRSFADYLRGFARQTVSGLWLTGISIDAASGALEISGRTVDPSLLPEYIRRLDREPAFEGQSFAALKLGAGKTEATAVPSLRPPYHEFVLSPVKPGEPNPGAAKLTHSGSAAGGAG